MKRLPSVLAAAAVMAFAYAVSTSEAQVTAPTTCNGGTQTVWDLTAGQTIKVGTVTVTNDADNLYVTYALTYPDATFGTLHLWAGNNLANMPATGQGAPIPGQFPYQHDATGLTTYTFVVPLSSLGIVDVTTACPLQLFVVTHAEVDLDGEEEGHETAFGGPNPGGGLRWWFYGTYCLICDDVTLDFLCQTAFAKGGWVFVTDKKSNPENLPSLNLIKNRWGWAINIPVGSSGGTYDVWSGAGLNKTSNGTLVGQVSVSWDGTTATVTYSLTAPYVMSELHIYAADVKPATTAPGQYGHTAYFDPKTNTYTETFQVADTNGDGIWIIAHAVSCYPAAQ